MGRTEQRRPTAEPDRGPAQQIKHPVGGPIFVVTAIENIWEYMRQNWVGHQVWPSYEAIIDACCEAWNKLMQMPERIASITQRSWAANNGH